MHGGTKINGEKYGKLKSSGMKLKYELENGIYTLQWKWQQKKTSSLWCIEQSEHQKTEGKTIVGFPSAQRQQKQVFPKKQRALAIE